jgi:SAM-dependent methyltransferase
VREEIRDKYRLVARSTAGCFRYPTGREGIVLLGYDTGLLAGLPDTVVEGFCGVGNPWSIAPVAAGAAILDIGCGTGFDLIVASRLTGNRGRVMGIDLTAEMIDRAQQSIRLAGAANVETVMVEDERIPAADATFDVVVSNGVINLSPDKPGLFAEIVRVLKPGGRLQFADIIQEKPLPPELAGSAGSWSH